MRHEGDLGRRGRLPARGHRGAVRQPRARGRGDGPGRWPVDAGRRAPAGAPHPLLDGRPLRGAGGSLAGRRAGGRRAGGGGHRDVRRAHARAVRRTLRGRARGDGVGGVRPVEQGLGALQPHRPGGHRLLRGVPGPPRREHPAVLGPAGRTPRCRAAPGPADGAGGVRLRGGVRDGRRRAGHRAARGHAGLGRAPRRVGLRPRAGRRRRRRRVVDPGHDGVRRRPAAGRRPAPVRHVHGHGHRAGDAVRGVPGAHEQRPEPRVGGPDAGRRGGDPRGAGAPRRIRRPGQRRRPLPALRGAAGGARALPRPPRVRGLGGPGVRDDHRAAAARGLRGHRLRPRRVRRDPAAGGRGRRLGRGIAVTAPVPGARRRPAAPRRPAGGVRGGRARRGDHGAGRVRPSPRPGDRRGHAALAQQHVRARPGS